MSHDQFDDPIENPWDTPIPKELPVPRTFRCIVMPMRPIRKSAGGLIIPDKAADTQEYVNSLGILVAMGPSAFRSPVPYRGLSEDEMAFVRNPKIGDWVTFGKHAGVSFEWHVPGGDPSVVKLKWVNDDAIFGIIDKPELYKVNY